MATGRMARVIDNLLTAAEQAADEQAWDRVLDLCEDVLAVEPDNPDASALRLLAERHVGRAIPAAGRRQVTVLFADLVGSTPMGEQLDPETYLEVIRAYETACRPVIDRYGGHINRFAGDGLIAFFGYPNAHEDDARRATRAGVEALEALRIVSERTASEHGVEIAARIGVHTGLVVLGDRGSAAWTGRDDAFGPTVNLAARLQAVATPGTVVVSDSVALLLGPAIELVSHGPRTLTGVPRSVEVFEVVRVVDGGRAPQALARAKLVDRKDQLDDPAGTRLGKLVALVERLGLDAGDMVPYLAIPLSIDVRGRFDPVELDALQLKDELLSHLVALCERLPSSGTPFVVAVEEVQWADPMTLDLLERLVRGGPPSGVLLVATTRPSSTSPVANLPADVIELGPLTADDARALAADTADRRLDEALLDEIARRSDGVPLYVNQLVDALAVSGGSPTPEEIPLPLMELLQSRLDSVGAAKAVAQVAATIGRDFELSMLRGVIAALVDDPIGDLAPDAVAQHVTRLVSSHLDAAGKPVEASLIAYHYDVGGDAKRAVDAYLTAAERARRNGSFDEALAHIDRANQLLAGVPDAEAAGAELGVCLSRGLVATSLGGWAAEGVMADYERALELCGTGTHDPAVGADSLRALVGIWTWYCTKGD